jgi:transmembrane sensor
MDSRQIEDRAAGWLAKKDGGAWGAADEAALTRWLGESSAHLVAYLRLEAGWEKSARLNAFGAGAPGSEVPARGTWRASPFFEDHRPTSDSPVTRFRGLTRQRAWAAGMLLIMVGGTAFLFWPHDGDYRTPVGGIASVPLTDGSRVTLNTDTKIRVEVTPARRQVRLQRGEAFFEVARDPSRPFIVIAGGERITVLGTAFSVMRERNGVRVAVTQGRVRVDGPGRNETLAAGSVARVHDTGLVVQKEDLPTVERRLSWRRGFLTFEETTLAEAVAEINRYTGRKIHIEDPRLGALTLSGKLRLSNSDDLIELLRKGYGIEAREERGSIHLTSR